MLTPPALRTPFRAEVPPARVTHATVAEACLRTLLDGPVRPLHVRQQGRYGVYLETDDGEPLALLTHDAARLPFALVIAASSGRHPLPPSPVRAPTVGHGQLRLGTHRYVVGRWRAELPVRRRRRTPLARRRCLTLRSETAECGVPAALVGDLVDAVRSADPRRVDAAVHALVGLGPGATPAGDDVLAGLSVALQTLDHLSTELLATSVRQRLGRTTWLSAALLRSTVSGRPAADLGALPRCLDASAPVWDTTVSRLLGFGHTSGPAAAQGFAVGITHTDPARRA